jgi:hypothetical protein
MNVMDLPTRLPPLYATSNVDEIVPIFSGHFEVKSDSDAVSGLGKIELKWFPSPRVSWDLEAVDAGAFHSFFLLGPVKLKIPGYDNEISAQITSLNTSSDKPIQLFGIVDNGEGRQTTRELAYVIFSLANFTPFFGAVVRNDDGTQASKSRAILVGGGWRITLDGLWSQDNQRGELDEHFFLSHVGRVEREDGSTFRSDEAKPILDDLYWFLSFCRGRPTPAILPVGFDRDGRESWSEWGSWKIYRFKEKRNWYNDFSAEGLERGFPGFLHLAGDSVWNKPVRLAIYWYLEAENAGNDSGIILAQAAFELLAWSYFVETEQRYSAGRFDVMRFREKLTLLLHEVGVPLVLPQTLQELATSASTAGWNDGPSALVGIRNAMVHPTTKNQNRIDVLTGSTLFEASQLSLWYLEMILLWLFRYHGSYSNRLIISGWKGEEVAAVPWVAKK